MSTIVVQEQSYDTIGAISLANLSGDTKYKYPTELAFISPLLITAILVLLPSWVLYYWFSEGQSRVYQIFWGNWISPLILWFFAACAVYLLLKKRKLQQELYISHILASNIIPAVLEETTNHQVASAELFRQFKDKLLAIVPTANVWNLLLSRCRLLLLHHNHLSENNHLDDDNTGLFEHQYMQASFAIARFMVWAIPILGFIGTVWGISDGIAYFSNAMSAVESVTEVSATLKDNLPLITRSLATAFDTTFVALILSIPLMLMMTWFEKAEENYLITLDELWLYDIKPKLSAKLPKPSAVISAIPGQQTATVNPEFQSISEELKLLTTQVSALQETMGDLYETVFASSLGRIEK
jgi:biopolymer transport protein ExbB/TolQ